MSALSEYITRIAEFLPSKVSVSTKKLEDGFSNTSYLIGWQGEPRLVLRLPGIEEHKFAISRRAELATVTQAALLGITPPLLWQDEHGVLVSQYVEQPALSWQVAHDPMSVQRLANLLIETHSMEPNEHCYCVYAVIEHYLKQIVEVVNNDDLVTKEWQFLTSWFQTLTPSLSPLASTLCHNDVNPKNVLMDGQTAWLIDWEYAGHGDPLFDLAVVVQSHNLSESLAKRLCQFYDEKMDFSDIAACLYNYRQAYVIRELAWLLLYYLHQGKSSSFLESYYQYRNTPQVKQLLNENE
ncbi:phosphotransferase [Marinomonas sp.]